MTLNGVMAINFRYFDKLGSFPGQLHVRKSSLISHQQIFSREMS